MFQSLAKKALAVKKLASKSIKKEEITPPDYYIDLSHNNREEQIYLPVLPEKLEIKKKGKGASYDIVGLGEINVIQTRELAEIAFESFFPERWGPFVSLDERLLREPKYYTDLINRWQESKYPSRILIKGPNLRLTLAVSIEQFDRHEAAGSGDIHYRLALKEYRFYAPRRLIVGTGNDGKGVVKDQGTKRPDERVPPATYKVVQGDTLWRIAQVQLGNGARWGELQTLNGLSSADVVNLQIGRVLKLPERK